MENLWYFEKKLWYYGERKYENVFEITQIENKMDDRFT